MKSKSETLLLAIADFPDAIDVKMENGWVVIVLATCRIKFRQWK